MIAKVVVDVPASQTDRMFDYLIPAEWEETLEAGMRVAVPFGPRSVQGFVVDIVETSEIEKLKPLVDVLDVTPVLTKELMVLAEWLTDTTLCFKVSAFQVMLPAALKGKVKKEILLKSSPTELPESLQPFFLNKNIVDWDEITKSKPSLIYSIRKAMKHALLEVNYVVKDQVKKKTQKAVSSLVPHDELESIIATFSNRATKQAELLRYVTERNEVIPIAKLMENGVASSATIRTLVNKKLLQEKEIEIFREPYQEGKFKQTSPLPLTAQQEKVIKPILQTIDEQAHRTFLLHGVTGSGKTEIYLQSIEEVLKRGKEAIVLVPEISLTPQMVERFKGRFGSMVAVLHSGLSMGEKYDEWRKIHQKEVKVVVGARSAIFAPFENLGIIIIDEEHEGSYKQEDNPRYHARDVAIFRGEFYNCPVILGSATPSLETYARALKGRYELLSLLERVNQGPMPSVEIIDMREELRSGNRSMFSTSLMDKLKLRIERKEQTVLFLNRRGYSTFIMCRDCGYVGTCQHCDISLTYHRTTNSLRCHYCGLEEKMPTDCPACSSNHIRFFGSGTQKVEEELTKLLPEARVIRMDVDTTRKKGSHERLLQAFGEGKGDILLGTQMVAKGLDFPNITLVGVLSADTMLHLPDFRSAERTFQLLTQVSGRAGRHQLPGEVVVQTYTPEHYSIELVKQHDYIGYFHREMHLRKSAGYPPYYFMTLINVSHPELVQAIHVTEKITSYLKRELSAESTVLGPVASPIARIKDRYRYQCMIKYKNEPNLSTTLKGILQHYIKEIGQGDLHISIDMTPQMFM